MHGCRRVPRPCGGDIKYSGVSNQSSRSTRSPASHAGDRASSERSRGAIRTRGLPRLVTRTDSLSEVRVPVGSPSFCRPARVGSVHVSYEMTAGLVPIAQRSERENPSLLKRKVPRGEGCCSRVAPLTGLTDLRFNRKLTR